MARNSAPEHDQLNDSGCVVRRVFVPAKRPANEIPQLHSNTLADVSADGRAGTKIFSQFFGGSLKKLISWLPDGAFVVCQCVPRHAQPLVHFAVQFVAVAEHDEGGFFIADRCSSLSAQQHRKILLPVPCVCQNTPTFHEPCCTSLAQVARRSREASGSNQLLIRSGRGYSSGRTGCVLETDFER